MGETHVYYYGIIAGKNLFCHGRQKSDNRERDFSIGITCQSHLSFVHGDRAVQRCEYKSLKTNLYRGVDGY